MPAPEFIQYGTRAWYWSFLAYFRLWFVQLKIRFSGFGWLRKQIEFQTRKNSDTAIEKTTETALLAMHEAVRLAARLPILRSDCLPKSIVLASMLRSRRCQARAVIGVSKVDSEFASHAWVEVWLNDAWQMVGEPESVSQQFTAL